MTQNRSAAPEAPTAPVPQPDAALKRLEKLVGKWELKGRTLDAQEDNITGWMTAEWVIDGFFLEQRGEMTFMGQTFQSMEVLGYDPETDTFPSAVLSGMNSRILPYVWDVQGDTVTHWTEGSKYTGTFSADGNTLTGGWRPDNGVASNNGNTYDATMIRVK